MKWISVLFVVALLHMCTGVKAQGLVTISARDASLEEVFTQIEKQTGYVFFYNEDVLKNARPVTLSVQKMPLTDVLDRLFKNQSLQYRIESKTVTVFRKSDNLTQSTQAGTGNTPATIDVSGRVVNENREGVPSATVKITGQMTFIVTAADGTFELKGLDANAGLTITSIGYEPRNVKLNGRTTLEIALTPAYENITDEVVVTGYQVIDKRVLTSSIATVKADDLDRKAALTIDQMLEGKAAGLLVVNQSATPGAAAKVRVRSGGTFTGSRAPLWVVDGIIYEDPVPLSPDDINSYDRVNLIGNALTGINPQDIESINILKDASATAIYGTRAANGVIVVTTKRGHKGRLSVSYNGGINMVQRPNYNQLNLMNSKERVDVSREIASKNLGYPNDIFTWVGYEKAFHEYRLGNITYAEFQAQVGQIETMNTDWFDKLYQNSITSNHALSLSGGSDNIRYYYSIGYSDNQGTERNTGLQRITGRSNIDATIRKNLVFTINMSGSVQNAKYNHGSLNLFDEAYYNSRAMPIYNEDGSLYYIESKLRESGGQLNTVKYNMLNEMENSQRNIDNKDFNINTQVNWTIAKGIKFMALASYRNTTNLQEEWITDKTAYIAKLRSYDEAEDKIDSWVRQYASVPFGGIYSGGMVSQTTLRGQAQLNLSKVIAKHHSFNLNLGYEANSNKYKGSTGWMAPGYNHVQGRSFISLPRASFVASTGELNNYGYLNMIKWLTGQDGYDVYPAITDRLRNQLSAFGIFNYSFDNKYIINFNARSDGSNQFGQYERYKFKPTWSVSGRWNLHNEDFWRNSEKIEELALRVSYGFRGIPPAAVAYMILGNYGYNSNFNENTATMLNFPNADLTWEKTSTLNAGLNFSMYGGRLNGTLDFAYSHGTDLLLSRPVSLVNGQRTELYNGGEKKDYTYEATVSGVVVKRKNWGWRVSVNGTVVRENILAGYAVDNTTLNVSNYLGGTIYLTGFPVDGFYSYQFDGLNGEGLPKFKNLENKTGTLYDLLSGMLVYSGTRSPKIYGGLNNEIRYKSFTLRGVITYKLGYNTRLLPLYNGQQNLPMPQENMSAEFVNRWRSPGDELNTVIPGLSNNTMVILTSGSGYYNVANSKLVPVGATGYTLYDYSDIRVVNASHLRLQSVGLSYTLSQKLVKRIGLSSLALGGEVSNVAVFAFDKKLKGQDPEQVRSVGMPVLRTFNLNLNVGF